MTNTPNTKRFSIPTVPTYSFALVPVLPLAAPFPPLDPRLGLQSDGTGSTQKHDGLQQPGLLNEQQAKRVAAASAASNQPAPPDSVLQEREAYRAAAERSSLGLALNHCSSHIFSLTPQLLTHCRRRAQRPHSIRQRGQRQGLQPDGRPSLIIQGPESQRDRRSHARYDAKFPHLHSIALGSTCLLPFSRNHENYARSAGVS